LRLSFLPCESLTFAQSHCSSREDASLGMEAQWDTPFLYLIFMEKELIYELFKTAYKTRIGKIQQTLY
jgi:hypothetical protein